MIPKIIHYCWFGNSNIPKSVKKCIKSWEKFCPDYKIMCWNENNYDVNSNDFVQQAYKQKKWAFVSDYVRLDVVYKYGGIYLDTDVELIKPLDDLLNYDFYIGYEKKPKYVNTGLGFGAKANNILVGNMLLKYKDHLIKEQNFDWSKIACPIINTEALVEFGFKNINKYQNIDNMVVFPSEYFNPISLGISETEFTENTYSIHHYDASWMGETVKFRRKIIHFIGYKNVANLRKIKNFFLFGGKSGKSS